MAIRVRLFAGFRDIVGQEWLEIPAEAGLSVGEIWAGLSEQHPALRSYAPSAAINAEFTSADTEPKDGDVLAFLPPVSGG